MATSIVKFITPIIYGAVIIFLLFWFGFVIYWIMKKVGMIKLFKGLFSRKPKEDVYETVAKLIGEGYTFTNFAEFISKFPLKIQEQYIKVWYEMQRVKGGKNGKRQS